MKLVQITAHFEYTDEVEAILDAQNVAHYVVYPMIEGKDSAGRHEGTQVHPGNLTVIQAQVEDESVKTVLDALRQFREARPSHKHLEALVLPIEARL
jgi:hypothetical protein